MQLEKQLKKWGYEKIFAINNYIMQGEENDMSPADMVENIIDFCHTCGLVFFDLKEIFRDLKTVTQDGKEFILN